MAGSWKLVPVQYVAGPYSPPPTDEVLIRMARAYVEALICRPISDREWSAANRLAEVEAMRQALAAAVGDK